MVDTKELRKTWAPLLRIAYASGADLVADWFFYQDVNNDDDPAVEKYQLYIFIFFIVSAVMCGVTLFGVLLGGVCPGTPLSKRLNQILGLEILIGDVPQFILTGMITYSKGLLTPVGAFNLATSAYNSVLNILESCGNVGEDETEEKEAPLSTTPVEPVDDPEVELHPAVIDEA